MHTDTILEELTSFIFEYLKEVGISTKSLRNMHSLETKHQFRVFYP